MILHVSAVYHAMKDDLMINLEGMRQDVCWFLSLPIPKAVWARTKLLQNDDFVAFVESCLHQP